MKGLPPLPASVLARQTPAVRAQLAAAGKRAPRLVLNHGALLVRVPPHNAAVFLPARPAFVAFAPGLALPSLANLRGDWTKGRAVREARRAVYRVEAVTPNLGRVVGVMASMPDPQAMMPLPWCVTITRIAPRAIRDGDNLVTCAKGVRDSLAAWANVDDSDPRVTWVVEQRRGLVSVEIVVATMNPTAPPGVPVPEV